jgi:hypothetical protein
MRGDGRLVDPAKMLPSNGTGEVGGHGRDRSETTATSMVLPRKRGEHSQRYIEEAPVLVQRGRKTGGGGAGNHHLQRRWSTVNTSDRERYGISPLA